MGHDEGGAGLQNPYAAPPLITGEAAVRHSVLPEEMKPFRTIWTRPRDTIRWIVATNPQLHVVLLICLAGIGGTLDRASRRNLGDHMPMWGIIGLAFVFGPLTGLIGLWIYSHLIRLTGTWIGGVASREHIKAAIAWASVPTICALPLWIPQLLLLGPEAFTTVTPQLAAQPMLAMPVLALALTGFVFGIWSFVLLCNTIAEVQGFRSAWTGLANMFLAGAVIVIPVMLIVFVAIIMSQV